ncbi:MAG: M20 family metallopeptidase [Proteobacteria bacterium]|nr:M20 family metallopeptidase [Pseudomonadota bacterium]
MPHTEIGSSEALLDELSEWVKLETPTTDPAAVNRLMDVAEAGLGGAGAAIERIPGRDGFGDNLIARMRQKHHAPDARPVLVAGHLDTVWAEGTLARMPFKVNGEKAHGPGIHDMKAGSFIAFHALREIMRQGVRTPRPVTLLLTPDEEVGSPTSRDVIEREAAGAACVLIPEPAGQGGAAVTSRKGVGRFRLTVRGIGAHAGGAFEHGASAIVELAHQIRRIHEMVDLDAGITLNVAPVWGGTRPNVIAAEAGCEIDLRVPSIADGERMAARLLSLEPVTANCKVTVTGEMNRPPFAETPGITALYEHARAVAEGLGLPMPRQHRGGGSDGNFTAALGIPTLDGLGCLGSGAHARHEHILWRHLAPRAALMAGLLETLD